MFLYRARAAQYAAGNPDEQALDRLNTIRSKLDAAQPFVRTPDPASVKLPGPLDISVYKAERVDGQISWFRKKADGFARTRNTYSRIELGLAICGALLSAALTVVNQQFLGAWVAVITTILGVIGAHVAAQRYDQLIVSYRSTADRLENAALQSVVAHETLPQFVERCEAILLQENSSWIAGVDESLKAEAAQSNPSPRKD